MKIKLVEEVAKRVSRKSSISRSARQFTSSFFLLSSSLSSSSLSLQLLYRLGYAVLTVITHLSLFSTYKPQQFALGAIFSCVYSPRLVHFLLVHFLFLLMLLSLTSAATSLLVIYPHENNNDDKNNDGYIHGIKPAYGLELNNNNTSLHIAAAAYASPQQEAQNRDRFGIAELNPTKLGGLEWLSNWDNGHPRIIGNEVDPEDRWYDTSHGDGVYTIDGKGTLIAKGAYVRMYVHDPANIREWSENLEITVYVQRINETQLVSYSGPELFARTNHGTNGDEDVNLCDDRGYGGSAFYNGKWAIEKEIAHHLPNGYAEGGLVQPWANFTRNLPVGIKFIVRNMDNNTHVKLELYSDITNGQNGGSWQKMTEFVDNGQNFGVGNDPCKSAVNPAQQLIHSIIGSSSETKKPMLSAYIRSEFATSAFSRFSIREIDPLP